MRGEGRVCERGRDESDRARGDHNPLRGDVLTRDLLFAPSLLRHRLLWPASKPRSASVEAFPRPGDFSAATNEKGANYRNDKNDHHERRQWLTRPWKYTANRGWRDGAEGGKEFTHSGSIFRAWRRRLVARKSAWPSRAFRGFPSRWFPLPTQMDGGRGSIASTAWLRGIIRDLFSDFAHDLPPDGYKQLRAGRTSLADEHRQDVQSIYKFPSFANRKSMRGQVPSLGERHVHFRHKHPERRRLPLWKKIIVQRSKSERPLATLLPLEAAVLPNLCSKYVKMAAQWLSRIGRWHRGNDVRLFDESARCFEAILSAIDEAHTRVWVETYAMDRALAGRTLMASLTRAAARGADVILSVDGVGCLGLPPSFFKKLRGCGGRVVIFNPLWRPIGPIVYRTHRKLLLADEVAFCGSLNFDWRSIRPTTEPEQIHDVKVSPPVRRPPDNIFQYFLSRVFPDESSLRPVDLNFHLALRGPIVAELADSFARHLQNYRVPLCRSFQPQSRLTVLGKSQGEVTSCAVKAPDSLSSQLRKSLYGFFVLPEKFTPSNNTATSVESTIFSGPSGLCQRVQTSSDDGTEVIKDVVMTVVENCGPKYPSFTHSGDYTMALRTMIKQATHSLCLASSYFHPPRDIRRALTGSLRRGLPTLLMLSGLSDVPLDTRATLAVLPYFLAGTRNRCRAFFLSNRHCHVKAAVADGTLSLVGSANLDRLSLRRNCELGILALDFRLADLLRRRMHHHLFGQKGEATALPGTAASSGVNGLEYRLTDASDMSLKERAVSLLSYHLIRLSGTSWWDGFRPAPLNESLNITDSI